MTHENHPTDLMDFPGAAALERAGRTEPLDPAVQARAHSLILDAITADAAPARVLRPRFGRRRVFALAAAVAAIAVGAAIVPVTDLGGDGPAASASASEVFTAMADITLSDVANGQTITGAVNAQKLTEAYWKTTIRTWVEGDKAHTDDTYLARDKVVIKTQNGRTVIKENPNGASWPVGAGQVAWDDLYTLPTRPDALRRALAAGAKGSAAEQTVRQAGDLLTDAPVSPKLRAALYRVLAATPGAVVKEGVKDGTGRTGTQISWKWKEKWPVHSDHNPNWIVQPSTGRLLERNMEPGSKPGHISQRDTYLFAGPAKTTG
ncbi:CU044_5270 family protein [Streptomyces sp. NBC_00209]|uniref:CU044_5270 family protein n=1 Tax=Streptomyces sp. NBC_00209 TaxID=2975682 RepID=UPI00324D6F2C